MKNISILLTPLNYLRIRQTSKKWFDYILPLSLSAILSVTLSVVPLGLDIASKDGLISGINGLLQSLIGFYIASLAAIATFGNQTIDNTLSGNSAKLTVVRSGESKEVELTRRKFLCYLFGFLAFTSITLYFLGLLIVHSSVEFSNLFTKLGYKEYYYCLKFFVLFIYILIFSTLVINTLLGLHYLTDRVHR